MEERGDGGSSYLHRALRAKLLTAEATDAVATVDDGLAFFHHYRLCRTYLGAHSATDAEVLFEDRSGLEHGSRYLTEEARYQIGRAHV